MRQKTLKGHSTFKLFGRNIYIIYRHGIWKAKTVPLDKLPKCDAVIEDIDLSELKKIRNSFFDLDDICDSFRKTPEKVFGCIAKLNGEPVGYGVCYRKEYHSTQYKIKKCDFYIDAVFVSEQARGKNIAPAMLAYLMNNKIGKDKTCLLAIRRNNVSMIKCVNKLGFEHIKDTVSVRFFGKKFIYPTL